MSKTTTTRTVPKVTRKSKAERVARDFDAAALIDICTRQDFTPWAPRTELPPMRGSDGRFYHYKDNGSKVLAVAHLDSVQDHPTCQVTETEAGPLVTSGALDDRLGAYVILDLLPRLGITCDWLLTTDEEIGASTASEFGWADDERKPYNWMISFDRGGTDVVMYQYETDLLARMVEDAGARVGIGSFSDICYLDHLGCAGFNWGVGYQDYHGPRSHAWLMDTFRMVGSFVDFYAAHHDEFLAHATEDRDDWLDDGTWDDEDGRYVDGVWQYYDEIDEEDPYERHERNRQLAELFLIHDDTEDMNP